MEDLSNRQRRAGSTRRRHASFRPHRIHASMVEAQVADRAATASSDSGFQWLDAGIGAAVGIGAALAAVGIRSRRRIVA
jgi:hypothetical protein